MPHLDEGELDRCTTRGGTGAKAYGWISPLGDLLGYTLLYMYINIPWHLSERDAPALGAPTVLADAWFGTK
ncbi:hypothetical protein ACFYRY_04500 [Streptomyces sp. NPDC005263]|uniref:hypothetical protein n=1 Tax=Streptomyces sp. NPDC005263 TaxID=3364711 RepID=UPI003690483F